MSDERILKLETQVADLCRRLTACEDEQSIRKLHHLYGYMIDKCLYKDVVELFTEDAEVRFMGGIYKGKKGAERLYVKNFQARFTGGNNGPVDGFLLDHPQHQDVVDIADDAVTAYGRFRCTMQAGRHKDHQGDLPHQKKRQWWEGGLYENIYKKVDGIWRIHLLDYRPQWHADFENGWAETRPEYVPFASTTFPENPTGPDVLMSPGDVWLWPTCKILPFHNLHPVTGEPIIADTETKPIEAKVSK